jgi:hypothetical protein
MARACVANWACTPPTAVVLSSGPLVQQSQPNCSDALRFGRRRTGPPTILDDEIRLVCLGVRATWTRHDARDRLRPHPHVFVLVALTISSSVSPAAVRANPDASFAEWIYRRVARIMAPFRGISEPVPLDRHSVLDTSVRSRRSFTSCSGCCCTRSSAGSPRAWSSSADARRRRYPPTARRLLTRPDSRLHDRVVTRRFMHVAGGEARRTVNGAGRVRGGLAGGRGDKRPRSTRRSSTDTLRPRHGARHTLER